MIEYVKCLDDFWSEDLSGFVFSNSYIQGQRREHFHDNIRSEVSTIWQHFDDELPSCWRRFIDNMDLDYGVVSWTKVSPGCLVPIHQDYFTTLTSRTGVDCQNCVRYIVMLDHWHFGQTVEFYDTVIRKWQRGDVWKFDAQEFHWAANVCNYDFVTCQISTVKS